MNILFPSRPFNVNEVSKSLKEEYELAKLAGHSVFLYDHEEFIQSGEFKSNLPAFKEKAEIIIRSWMMDDLKYSTLYNLLIQDRNTKIINSPEEYSNCHYLPNYYDYIKEISPKAVFFPEEQLSEKTIELMLQSISTEKFILKDYVKSEKSNPDLHIIPTDLLVKELYRRLVDFKTNRRKLFNKGFVLKEYVELKKYKGLTNEYRLFYLYGSLLSMARNTECPVNIDPPANFLTKIDEIIKKIKSNFFTIDIAEKEDSSWIVIEMGDGQVSGLAVMDSAISFFNNILTHKKY